ncbi:MAG: hypothetical protein KAH01_08450 [Caldisericia bacterium]|nr:hypothetical protein [Caldisericia bacterium]
MKIKTSFKRLLMCVLCCFLFLSFSSFTVADEKNTSSVIGYGPIAEDLILPSSTLIHENKLYVLDQYSITVFDVSSKKVISKHLIDYQNFLPDYESPENFLSVIQDFTVGPASILTEVLGIGPKQMLYTQKKYYVQPSMCLDSKNRLYVTAQDGIHVLVERFLNSVV